MMWQFNSLLQAIAKGEAGFPGENEEAAVMSRVFESLGRADFSRHVLQRIPDQALVMPLEDVDWNDWGSPARIKETLQKYGKEGRFQPRVMRPAPSRLSVQPSPLLDQSFQMGPGSVASDSG